MKYLLLILISLLIIGCSKEQSPQYDKFVATYGATDRFYCDETGFLIHEYPYHNPDIINRDLVINDADIPIRCNVKDISIRVKETVASGALSGSVQ